MQTQRTTKSIQFHLHNRREVEQRAKIIRQFAMCFTDYRSPILTEHSVGELVAQRVYGLALGYEDLNDHDDLRACGASERGPLPTDIRTCQIS